MYYAIIEISPKKEDLKREYIDAYIVFFINFNKENAIDDLIRFYIESLGWEFIRYEEFPAIVEIKDFPGDNNVKVSAFKEAEDKGYSYVLYTRKKPESVIIRIKEFFKNLFKK